MKRLLTIAIILLGSMQMLAQESMFQKQMKRFEAKANLYAHRHQDDSLAVVLTTRTGFLYNCGLSDSVAAYAQHDMPRLKELKQWDRYFEMWNHLINSYIYYNKEKTKALHEVDDMFKEAMALNHQYGMGIAYYAMGNVYLNFNNLSQSADSYQKGLDILLGAFGKLDSDYNLIVAGEPYGSFDKYQAIIDASPAKDRIHLFTNYIKDSEVKNYFSAADLVVLPYKSATQSGISAISNHFEVPMVVTDTGGLKQAVGESGTGLVADRADEECILEKIREFFGNENLRTLCISAIRAEKERLSWKTFSRKLLDFTDNLYKRQ